jgi:DNA-binding transcriptional regulator YiaG
VRLSRGLSKAAVGRQMGVDQRVLWHWENEPRDPAAEVWPRIIKFLGYYPHPSEGNIAAQVLMLRRFFGESRGAFGRRFAACTVTVRHWEMGERAPAPDRVRQLNQMVNDSGLQVLEARRHFKTDDKARPFL